MSGCGQGSRWRTRDSDYPRLTERAVELVRYFPRELGGQGVARRVSRELVPPGLVGRAEEVEDNQTNERIAQNPKGAD